MGELVRVDWCGWFVVGGLMRACVSKISSLIFVFDKPV